MACDSILFVDNMENHMPWNDITRRQHNREGLRYPSDLTDREWELLRPLVPPAKSGGRPRSTEMREVMDAILYIASSGCQGGASGGCCRVIFRHSRLCKDIFMPGETQACCRP